MYAFYKVYGCKITTTFFNDDSAYSEPLNVGIIMRAGDFGTHTDKEWLSIVRGDPNAVCKTLIPAYRTTKCSMFRRMGALYGNNSTYSIDSAYNSRTNGEPTTIFYGFVFAATAKPADVSPYPPAATIWCKTEVTYYVKFWGFKYPSSSGVTEGNDIQDLPWNNPGGATAGAM